MPDDGRRYDLPPSLGQFPLRAVDELRQAALPEAWKRRGGIALPMWQSEACWLSFSSETGYPFAVKIGAGKINAVNGKPWSDTIDVAEKGHFDVPLQPWLDGFCVGEGIVRQFVAMPLGQGYTAEEQVTGQAEHGGIQILVHPMKPEVWTAQQRERATMRFDRMFMAALAPSPKRATFDMGRAPGGAIRQTIAKPHVPASQLDFTHRARCFVHIANSEAWAAIAGGLPPTQPPSAADYAKAGLPWFAWYDDRPAHTGSRILAALKSVATLGADKGETPLPENEGFEPPEPIRLGPAARRAERLEGSW